MVYAIDLEASTRENTKYRRILYTSKYQQLVLMCLNPGDSIPEETHHADQFFRVEEGSIHIIVSGTYLYELSAGQSITIDAGTSHFVKQVGESPAKLYTVYSPPVH